MKKMLSILAAAAVLAGVLTIQAPQAQAASGTYLGTYDLRGDGTMQMGYRNGGTLDIVDSWGGTRSYSFGNTVWAVGPVEDMDGVPGKVISIKAGGDAYIIHDRSNWAVKYPVGGNRSWAIVGTAETNNKPGAELILNIGEGIRVIRDSEGTYRHNL